MEIFFEMTAIKMSTARLNIRVIGIYGFLSGLENTFFQQIENFSLN